MRVGPRSALTLGQKTKKGIAMFEYDETKGRWIDQKISMEGQECRKCGTAVIKKQVKLKKLKKNQTYYYDWYLLCPECRTMYMVETAKVMVTQKEHQNHRRFSADEARAKEPSKQKTSGETKAKAQRKAMNKADLAKEATLRKLRSVRVGLT